MLQVGYRVGVGDFLVELSIFIKNNCNSLQETNDCRIPKSLFWPAHYCFSVILSLERFQQRQLGRVLCMHWNLQVNCKIHCQNAILSLLLLYHLYIWSQPFEGIFHPKMKREKFSLAFYSVVGLGAFLSLFPGGFDFLWKHWINTLSCSSSKQFSQPSIKGVSILSSRPFLRLKAPFLPAKKYFLI